LFSGHTVALTNTSANIGGQTISVSGGAELNDGMLRPGGLPPFQFHLRGTNVPLVRKPGLLLRANLDVDVTNSPPSTPIVTGTVTLRDGLFLADLQSLVPETAASPKLRPPYFSIEEKPWADWGLKMNLKGEGFLRAQTPLFHGKVSTTMKLEGTLKEPMALGEVRIDSGAVTFPFGSLDVKQGFVSLTSENPYHPQIFVTASAQRFGYEITMEATGPADSPAVRFSSMPSLTSEQIVLMLTTGQLPPDTGMASSTRQRAQGLALFLGKNLLSQFGLGVGGQDRLSFTSGSEISESGRPTYDVEYNLGKRWSIIGQYDRFDQFNLNLKWRAYSK
jgi:translocation and assembly module TamB